MFTMFVNLSRLGKAMRATAQDRDAALLMGIDINQTISAAFFLGAVLAGAGGIIFGLYFNSVRFDLGFEAGLIAFTAAVFGGIGQFMTGGNGLFFVSTAADAGVYILLALGLNVVVGFAGLLDLGYAAFFAIGAYTYALLASSRLGATPLHHEVHIPFWLLLLVAVCVAAMFGLLLGAPTLRLRGDYLAIVTLGFGEIVPRVFRNLATWTAGVNGISGLDPPTLPVWINGPWAGLPFGITRDFQFIDPTQF